MEKFITQQEIWLRRKYNAEYTRWILSGERGAMIFEVIGTWTKNWITGAMDMLPLGKLIVFGDYEEIDEDEEIGYRFIRHDGEVMEGKYIEDDGEFDEHVASVIADQINVTLNRMLSDWDFKELDHGYLITFRPAQKLWLVHGEEGTEDYFLHADDLREKVLVRLNKAEIDEFKNHSMPARLALGVYHIVAFRSTLNQEKCWSQLKDIVNELFASSPYDYDKRIV